MPVQVNMYPIASLISQGIVMLNDTTNSFSTTLAATPNSVRIAYDTAREAVRIARSAAQTQWSDYSSNIIYDRGSVGIGTSSFDISFALYVHGDVSCQNIVANSYQNLPISTTERAGIVRLEGDIFSAASDRAATAENLNRVYTIATQTATTLSNVFGGGDVTTGFKELTVNTISATRYVGIPTSTTRITGMVRLSDATATADSTRAATSFAVKQLNDKINNLYTLWGASSLAGVAATYANVNYDIEVGNIKCVALNCSHYLNLPIATSTMPGVVVISDSLVNADSTQAASSMAVKQLSDRVDKLSNAWTAGARDGTIVYTGNIGVNTSAPTSGYDLDLVGSARITNSLKVGDGISMRGVHTYSVTLIPTGMMPLTYVLNYTVSMKDMKYTIHLTPQSTEARLISCVVTAKSPGWCTFNVYSIDTTTGTVAPMEQVVTVDVLLIE